MKRSIIFVIVCNLFFIISYCQDDRLIPKFLHQCTTEDLDLLREGFTELRNRGILNYYANIHSMHFGMAHNDPREFFPFHGQMIDQMNNLLKSYDQRLRIPVWDIRIENVYPPEIYYITRGWPELMRNFPPRTPLRMNAGQRASSLPFGVPFIQFTNICADIHNDIHNYYGGTFGSPWSPLDPLFWVFHAFWDDVYKEYMSIHNMGKMRTMMPIRMPNL